MSQWYTLTILDVETALLLCPNLELGSGYASTFDWTEWTWHEDSDGPDGWEGWYSDSLEVTLRFVDEMIERKRAEPAWKFWRDDLTRLAGRPGLRFFVVLH